MIVDRGAFKTVRSRAPPVLNWIKSLFATPAADQSLPARLDASGKAALAGSLRGLPVGERGWITFEEARHLFSSMDAQYAFGEMDEEGNVALKNFATEAGHRARVEFFPVEGRVYFIRTDT